MQALKRLADIKDRREREQLERGLDLGLAAAPSVNDRTISTFSRGQQPAFAGINTFLKAPYCENIRDVGNYDVAILGAPFDMGTTYRAGCRFGPQAVRRISALYDSYNADMAVDLYEELNLCDAGDVFVIPSNIEKSFDQIDRAVSFIHEQGVFPVVIGGDHSIGYPDVRAIAPHIEGKVGIIHLDRHIDMQERDMDERMHTTPWFHASNIPNAPGEQPRADGHRRLVRLAARDEGRARPPEHGDHDLRRRGARHREGRRGRARVRVEGRRGGLPVASTSTRSTPGFVPGTGSPEPGGMLPREALKALRMIAREGICGMEVVEIAPPYDVSDMTAQLGCRAIMDVLGTLVEEGYLGSRRPAEPEREQIRLS